MPERSLRHARRIAAIAFTLAAVTLLAAIGSSFRNTERLVVDADWRQHTFQVIAEIRGLLNALIDAQTGERGYLVTGDARFLAPWRAGVAAVPAHLAALRTLTADNPRQQRRLAALAPEAQADLAALDAAIERRRRLGAVGVSLADSLESRRVMDELRARIAELEGEESRLLGERDRALRASIRRADLSLLGGAVAGIALLVAAFLALGREIRQRRDAEEAQRRLNTRLEAANGELEAFTYSVSHDLRAPLRAIDGFSHALAEDAGERLLPGDRELLARVRAAAQRMAGLIDDLLRLSRISRTQLEPGAVDLSALAGAVVEELRRRDPERAAVVEIEPGVGGRGDERLLRIVLDNLLGNAWKFSRGRSPARIAFGAENGRGEPVYVVRDNGAGFDMTYADKLFGAFQRLHSAREFEGTGVGLATVARVVHLHGGRVWAESAVGEGATFRFTLDPALAPEKARTAS